MATRYAKRALEILREEGFLELTKKSWNLLLREQIFSKHRKFRLNTSVNHILNSMKYDAPPSVYEIVWENPKKIQYANSCVTPLEGFGQIRSGKWDKNTHYWRESDVYRGLKQRFVENYEWENTAFVEYHQKKIATEGSARGYKNIETFIEKRCSYLDCLYETMNDDGWKLKENEIVGEKNAGKRRNRPRWKDHYEPFASIGRRGEIQVSGGGIHRRSIAEFADIKRIPFNIVVRHKQWQELRDEIHNNGLPEEHEDLRDHPDLQDVLD